MRSAMLPSCVIALVTYGSVRQILLVRKSFEEWRLPVGQELVRDGDELHAAVRLVKMQTGVSVNVDQVHVLSADYELVSPAEGDIQPLMQPVLVMQVCIEVDQFLFRHDWKESDESRSFIFSEACERSIVFEKDRVLLKKYASQLFPDIESTSAKSV